MHVLSDFNIGAYIVTEVVHISSLLVRADPQKLDQILAKIATMSLAEVPISDPAGKIIVLLETDKQSEIVDAMTQLQLMDGVVNASLVYHQTD
jgi:periplasmic nitrate reductase NapD